jgi:hypothetical protein
MAVWPELTIQARSEEEVDCLLRALRKAGHDSLVRPGFCVEAGGARPDQILSVVQKCLSRYEIDSVNVSLGTGGTYELRSA